MNDVRNDDVSLSPPNLDTFIFIHYLVLYDIVKLKVQSYLDSQVTNKREEIEAVRSFIFSLSRCFLCTGRG